MGLSNLLVRHNMALFGTESLTCVWRNGIKRLFKLKSAKMKILTNFSENPAVLQQLNRSINQLKANEIANAHNINQVIHLFISLFFICNVAVFPGHYGDSGDVHAFWLRIS